MRAYAWRSVTLYNNQLKLISHLLKRNMTMNINHLTHHSAIEFDLDEHEFEFELDDATEL